MVDDQTQQGQTGGAAVADAGVVVDPAKTAEQYIKEAEEKYIVPQLIRTKFPDLVKLIFETESMNQEEREYWLQIMPIMTEEQIVKFRDILVNEKEQLTKLDQEYDQEINRIQSKQTATINEEEMKKKMQEIKSAETASKKQDKSEEEELLKKLEEI